MKTSANRGRRRICPAFIWLAETELFRQFQYLTVPLHADLSIKERALARTAALHTKPGRYRPGDRLLAFLDNL